MSLLSRVLTGIIIIGLAFIVAVRMYRGYEQDVAATQESSQTAQPVSSAVVASTGPVKLQLPVFRASAGAAPAPEIYLEDTALPPDLNKEQARQTLQSIMSDYRDNPQLQAFYADLQQSTGQPLDLTSLSGENLAVLLIKYPQIQEVITRHAQDPAFAKTLQEIFSNPQFVQSVAVLQQGKEK